MSMLNNQIVNHFPFRSFGISLVSLVLFRVFVEKSHEKSPQVLDLPDQAAPEDTLGFYEANWWVTFRHDHGMSINPIGYPLGIHWGTLFSDRSWLFDFSHILGMSSSQLTHIFQRGCLPPTSWCWPGFWQDPHGPVSRTWLLPWVLIPRWCRHDVSMM